jgi:NOL1/NOP2/sun family putative RNA methylase
MTFYKNIEPKPLFLERMKNILTNEKDFQDYLEILKKPILKSIRCNTLKISPQILRNKLEEKGWKLRQPWKDYPEVMIVEGKKIIEISSEAIENPPSKERRILKETSECLSPGELGNSIEHLLGYYYIQELASMLPILALSPKEGDLFLDLCASPGSKTTQSASFMENKGTIIANEVNMQREKILASNLEKCGVANTIITRKDGEALCKRFKQKEIYFDKILVDAPCSGEGTLRSTPKTYLMWNIKTVKGLPRIQKKLCESAFQILKKNGEMIYSTCTHAPEENEEVINFMLERFKGEIKLEEIILPISSRKGITKWEGLEYSKEIVKCNRIYPQDNNTEGFFLAKFKRIK